LHGDVLRAARKLAYKGDLPVAAKLTWRNGLGNCWDRPGWRGRRFRRGPPTLGTGSDGTVRCAGLYEWLRAWQLGDIKVGGCSEWPLPPRRRGLPVNDAGEV